MTDTNLKIILEKIINASIEN